MEEGRQKSGQHRVPLDLETDFSLFSLMEVERGWGHTSYHEVTRLVTPWSYSSFAG